MLEQLVDQFESNYKLEYGHPLPDKLSSRLDSLREYAGTIIHDNIDYMNPYYKDLCLAIARWITKHYDNADTQPMTKESAKVLYKYIARINTHLIEYACH